MVKYRATLVPQVINDFEGEISDFSEAFQNALNVNLSSDGDIVFMGLAGALIAMIDKHEFEVEELEFEFSDDTNNAYAQASGFAKLFIQLQKLLEGSDNKEDLVKLCKEKITEFEKKEEDIIANM